MIEAAPGIARVTGLRGAAWRQLGHELGRITKRQLSRTQKQQPESRNTPQHAFLSSRLLAASVDDGSAQQCGGSPDLGRAAPKRFDPQPGRRPAPRPVA